MFFYIQCIVFKYTGTLPTRDDLCVSQMIGHDTTASVTLPSARDGVSAYFTVRGMQLCTFDS